MSLTVMAHLLHERLSRHLPPREPEPELVMQSAEQTEAFYQAGRADGVLAFLYFFNALQITPLLRDGDQVLDLACGPANQLSQVARLHPHTRFIGLDASAPMLARARSTLDAAALRNVELLQDDMTRLAHIDDASMDGVICTMSLHHLPDLAALQATLRQLRRVLKPQGSIYLTDFGRLKQRRTQSFFARDLQQSAQFTRDYFNSLRAAFSVAELSAAVALLDPGLPCVATALAPFLVLFRSAARRSLDTPTRQRIQAMYEGLAPPQRENFRALAGWMQRSGMDLPCALK